MKDIYNLHLNEIVNHILDVPLSDTIGTKKGVSYSIFNNIRSHIRNTVENEICGSSLKKIRTNQAYSDELFISFDTERTGTIYDLVPVRKMTVIIQLLIKTGKPSDYKYEGKRKVGLYNTKDIKIKVVDIRFDGVHKDTSKAFLDNNETFIEFRNRVWDESREFLIRYSNIKTRENISSHKPRALKMMDIKEKMRNYLVKPDWIDQRATRTESRGYIQIKPIADHYDVDILVMSIYCQDKFVPSKYSKTTVLRPHYLEIKKELDYIARYMKIKKVHDLIKTKKNG